MEFFYKKKSDITVRWQYVGLRRNIPSTFADKGQVDWSIRMPRYNLNVSDNASPLVGVEYPDQKSSL